MDGCNKMKKGIIVSIQGYSQLTTIELCAHAIRGGAVAIRTDQNVKQYFPTIPIIGLIKKEVSNKQKKAYITPDIESVKEVCDWADYVAVDYRKINEYVAAIQWMCAYNHIKVVADIRDIEDFENIIANNYYYDYVATTFSVFDCDAQYGLVHALKQHKAKNIIAEGGYKNKDEVEKAFYFGANNVCIGSAISNINKLTSQFTGVCK
jgi:putative N-acetylmannosamine-6-phosphate epimerase